MFKFLTFIFAFVLAVMLLAPESYLTMFLTVMGEGSALSSNNTAEQLGTRLGVMLFAPMVIAQHMPYVLGGLFISILLWAFGFDKATD